ncbi:homeobox protein dve-1-like [Macrosteles quadrilineatus]|uniref:homeobox protein dve-1-like n=1 Tax=Macrosteles quadrilineatus TaxID=74068 RepID=UPI0023E11FA3|nr:homeobox protein dve-1-like [Macrosteles quadrilineatus]
MDFQSAMETFAEAWVAANTKTAENGPQNQALALITNRESRTPPESPASIRCSPAPPPPPPPPTASTPPTTAPGPGYPPHLTDDAKNGGKSLPVHCIVESVASLQQWKSIRNTRRTVLETDSYVIIPVNTTFQDLVQVALQRLGYPKENASAAKGSVVIKNWKPLSFDKIAESPLVTVGDILGELTTVATLRIQIFRPRTSVLTDMKDKLLRLLLVQSHALLLSSGCPLDEMTLSQLVRNQCGPLNMFEPQEEVRRKFDQWWSMQLNQQLSPRPRFQWHSPPPTDPERKYERGVEERVHPALQTVQNQYPTQKTRMRTSFDPELELPKLQRWFLENQHPSRQQIQQYVKELNNLESRRGRKPLDVNNVVYWFKNARAAQKRAEVRNMTPGMHCHLSLNGYNSSSQSPSSPVYMMKSPVSVHEDEDDEDQDRSSPIGPLSLTTTSRNSPSPSPRLQRPASTDQVEGVKQEPPDQELQSSRQSPNNHLNNNNNNNNKDLNNEMSNEDDDEMEDVGSEGEDGSKAGENQSPDEENRIQAFRNPGSPDLSLIPRTSTAGFPMMPHSTPPPWFSHSIMYMSHYMPNLNSGHNPAQSSPQGLNLSALADERRKRNRTFIDPVSEVPRLEQWFAMNTHPSHNLILKYTDDLNRMPYRQKFPRLEPKNVQFWFKNRRAKCKRLKMSLFDSPESGLASQQSYNHLHLAAALSGENYPPRD